MELSIHIDGEEKRVAIQPMGTGYAVTVDGRRYEICTASLSDGVLNFLMGYRSYRAFVSDDERGTHLSLRGREYMIRKEDTGGDELPVDHYHSKGTVEAPMPGGITAVNVAAGDVVKAGDPLVVLESMKMQNEVTSPVDGTVDKVCVKSGDQVAFAAVLVEIIPAAQRDSRVASP